MSKDPLLYAKTTDEMVRTLESKMALVLNREIRLTRKQDAGYGLIRLFGRMAEVIANRLNQVPEQHFRAFLNAAEVDQLPPRPARTELTFTPAIDGPVAIKVPKGTQVATRPTPDQPEIIFETERELTVVPTTLAHCVVVDPLNRSNRTNEANGVQATSFAAFAGQHERKRLFYIADDRVLQFDDPASRNHAVVTFDFRFAEEPQTNHDGWTLTWRYWDGAAWANLRDTDAEITDTTNGFLQNGKVEFIRLPDVGEVEVNGQSARWLACELSGGMLRNQLPTITHVSSKRYILLSQPQLAEPESGQIAIQAGAILSPVDPTDTFQLLGPQPGALDTFYLRVDEAFSKPGAKVTVALTLEELPAEITDFSEIDQLRIEWEYFTEAGWQPLGTSRRGCPPIATLELDRDPNIMTHAEVRQYPITRATYLETVVPVGYFDHETQPYSGKGKVLNDIYTGETFVQFPVPAACADQSAKALIAGHYTSATETLAFRDSTCAFTTSGVVQFRVPATQGTEAPWIPTTVGEEKGYWLRARLADGSYNVPQKAERSLLTRTLLATPPFLPPVVYAPVVADLQVSYMDYTLVSARRAPEHCRSEIDQQWHDHIPALKQHQAFKPFTQMFQGIVLEDSALYLGLQPLFSTLPRAALPAGQWIQLRVDVDEAARDKVQLLNLVWDYWQGTAWQPLQLVDESKGLSRLGYVGFFAPNDHQASILWGEEAYWLRARPIGLLDPQQMPYLYTIRLNTVPAVNAVTIEHELLGSSTGEPNQRHRLARPPVLPDIVLEVLEPELLPSDWGEHEFANPSQRDIEAESLTAAPPPAPQGSPATIAATSAPSLTEFRVAQPAAEATEHERWVAWRAVTTFYGCDGESRHYRLDSISGEVQFGNGVRGKIPPAGTGNIRVRRYRTHNGNGGNLLPGTITALRNPSGGLGDIQAVINHGPAAGGLGAETVEATKRRGPYSLKHRQRPVTTEDFQWITREADHVARAYCLPTRDRQGHHQPGWVTLVIVPDSTDAKPIPSKTLLRQVRTRLESLALTNLQLMETATDSAPATEVATKTDDVDQIHVAGPKYVAIVVEAVVVPRQPETADRVKFAVRHRLRAYLHPLTGGPTQEGWEPGRDVFISEIAAEIEQVDGVDHVDHLRLYASGMQQAEVRLTEPVRSRFDLPAGSIVSTFDGRYRMILGQRWQKATTLAEIVAHGFKLDDIAQVIDETGKTFGSSLPVTQVALVKTAETLKLPKLPPGNQSSGQEVLHAKTTNETPEAYVVTFAEPIITAPLRRQAAGALETQEGSVCLPLLFCTVDFDADKHARMTGVGVQMFTPGELISVTHYQHPRRREDFLGVQSIQYKLGTDRIFVPDDHLVCSDEPIITMKLKS